MIKRLAATLLVALTSAAMGSTAIAGGADRPQRPTEVTGTSSYEAGEVTGNVTSVDRCEAERTVILIVDGEDGFESVERAKTNAKGRYRFETRTGTFQAVKVRALRRGRPNVVCEKGVSPTFYRPS